MKQRRNGTFSSTFGLFFGRELRLIFSSSGVIAQPMCLFLLICILFPLSMPADLVTQSQGLVDIGGSVIWVAVLLSIMLSMENLFREDLNDGQIEQWLIGHRSVTIIVLAKVSAHWITATFLLIAAAPMVALAYGVAPTQNIILIVSLVLGTPSVFLIGAISAALTVTIERSGLLIALITLPLMLPVLIFGAGAVSNALQGIPYAMQLYALASILTLSITLAPLAIAAALRLTIE